MVIKRVLIASCIAILSSSQPALAADSLLADAAMKGDLATVRALLDRKVDVNVPQGDGSTALHWAAYKGDAEMVRLLLARGAGVAARTRLGGITPLMMAAKNGDAAITALLLDARAEVTVTNTNGTTPLMLAAAAGKPEAVALLLGRGAEVNAREATHGQTALMFAAAQGRLDAVKLLLQRKADANAITKVSPIISMTERYKKQTDGKGSRGITGEGGRSDVTSMGGMTALMFAAREGHLDVVRALVAAGADVNQVNAADNLSVLTLAIINGRFEIAQFLLERGANPNLVSKIGLGPLYATIDAQWPERTWYPPASVAEEKVTYLALLQALLDKGADPNVRLGKKPWYRTFHGDWADPTGATPLWLAAKANDVAAMKLLVERGANPTIPSTKGASPLLVAAGFGFEPQVTNFAPKGRLAAVRYLVEECGADVNAKDSQGYTPLHGAALTADHDLLLYLIAMGADVRARAKNVFGGEGQADKDAAGGVGDTVADMANGPRAHNMQFPDTVDLLERLGSENSNNCRYATCVLKTLPSTKK
ncbi:MAG TPA: ankyrin repeat domain-containing protein [Vicinamibacterales bacterium]|nr:ankyrin repeat domain-containing protein [Vicinamibacterales bacterium]